jgi:hypothetical protein
MGRIVSLTLGDQVGTPNNGRFARTCYHPRFVFDWFGGPDRCALRPGNNRSANIWHLARCSGIRRRPVIGTEEPRLASQATTASTGGNGRVHDGSWQNLANAVP